MPAKNDASTINAIISNFDGVKNLTNLTPKLASKTVIIQIFVTTIILLGSFPSQTSLHKPTKSPSQNLLQVTPCPLNKQSPQLFRRLSSMILFILFGREVIQTAQLKKNHAQGVDIMDFVVPWTINALSFRMSVNSFCPFRVQVQFPRDRREGAG